MFERNLAKHIDKLLYLFPAVVLTGVRQCGKTSLSRSLRPKWRYVDFENPADRDLILEDPSLFFQSNSNHLILDEVQLFPEILQALRGVIDADRSAANRFILTGSSSPDLLAHSAETLAGRVGLVDLAPLKTNELVGAPLSRFYEIFNSKLSADSARFLRGLTSNFGNEQIRKVWLQGGYPEPHCKENDEFYRLWYQNYIATFLNRDVRSYFPGLEIESYRRFLGMLRDFHAQEMNIAEVSRSLACSESTSRRYLDIAHKTFFWRKLPSYERTQLRSVVKTSRGLYRDSGLFHYLLGIHDFTALEQSRFRGASFEAFVIEELLRGVVCTEATSVESHFYRTRSGSEVDLILSGSFGTLPIEVKLSTTTTASDVPALSKFLEHEKLPLGIVVNFSNTVEYLTEKILRVPVALI